MVAGMVPAEGIEDVTLFIMANFSFHLNESRNFSDILSQKMACIPQKTQYPPKKNSKPPLMLVISDHHCMVKSYIELMH